MHILNLYTILIIFIFAALTPYTISEERTTRTFTVIHNKPEKEKESPSTAVSKRRLKILISNPIIGWSHSQFGGAIIDALIDAGHDVHMLTYVINDVFGNYTGTKKVRTIIRHERQLKKQNFLKNTLANVEFEGLQNMLLSQLWTDLVNNQVEICREIVTNRPLIEHLKNEQYDFATAEFYSPCMFGIFKVVGIRSMAISQAVALNSHITAAFGIPNFSSFIFDLWTSASHNPIKMTFLQRLQNFYEDFLGYFKRDMTFALEQPIFDEEFGEAAPSLRQVMRNISFAFVNSKDFFSMPRPLSSKIIYIGGIAEAEKDEKKAKPLPDQFKTILDGSVKGAVLFSFGTIAETRRMPLELRDAFANAFEKFPEYEFIWKYQPGENQSIKFAQNIHVVDWIPQTSILKHPRLRVFISHCGLNSVNEAAKAGVPVLGMPLFGDQAYNGAIIANKEMGIIVSLKDVRKKGAIVVEDALRRLLNDERYSQAARTVSRKLALTPFSPRERFVKWVEFAAEFPDLNELNMPNEQEMSLFVYYSLDVITALIAVSLIIVFALLKILSFSIGLLFCRQNGKKLHKKEL